MTVLNQNGFKPINSYNYGALNSSTFYFNLPDEAQEATLKIRINHKPNTYRPGGLFIRCRDALHDGSSFQGNTFQFDYQTNVYYYYNGWTDAGTVTNLDYVYATYYYNSNQTDRCAAVTDITLKNYATDDRLYNSFFMTSDWTYDTGGTSVIVPNKQFTSGYAYSSVGANTIRNIQLLMSNGARLGVLDVKVWAETEVSDG